MSSSLLGLTFDCTEATTIATFWSDVLGRSVDDGASPDFASIGFGDDSQPAWFFVKVPDGNIPQARIEKRRGQTVHVELHVADDGRAAEIERLIALGAVKLWDGEQGDTRWITMADPEGNAFCIA